MSDSDKTVKFVLDSGASFLEKQGIELPRLACELLLSRLLDCPRLELYLRFDHALSEKKLEAMRRGIKRVGQGEPVQYVIGQTEFMGHVLKVDRRALIPRPETEILVERVLARQDVWALEQPQVLDIGTGTGCIVLSLALAHPHGTYTGQDLSAEALSLARENAVTLRLADKVRFAEGELADLVEPESLDLIVSNPPYIPTAAYEQLPVQIRDHEPRMALDGGPDGLRVYEQVIPDASMALKRGGSLFLEIGEDQGEAVSALMQANGFEDVSVDPDLNERDRIVSGILS